MVLAPVWQATLGGLIGGALAVAAFLYPISTEHKTLPWKHPGSWPKYVLQVFLTLTLGAGAGWLIVGELGTWGGGCIVGLTGPIAIQQLIRAFGGPGGGADRGQGR